MVGAGTQGQTASLQPEDGVASLRRLLTPFPLLCLHFTPGVAALRLPFLLFALNVQLLFIAVFRATHGLSHVLARSLCTSNLGASEGHGLPQDQWFEGGQTRLEPESITSLNTPQPSEHSYLTSGLQLTSQTQPHSRAGPRKHVSSQPGTLCLSVSL